MDTRKHLLENCGRYRICDEVKKQSQSNVKAIVIDEAHLIEEWQIFRIYFYSFLLHQNIIFKAVNTFGPFDIIAIQSFSRFFRLVVVSRVFSLL